MSEIPTGAEFISKICNITDVSKGAELNSTPVENRTWVSSKTTLNEI